MKLYEIINYNDNYPTESINIERFLPYKKSLLTIYGDQAVLMVTEVFNAVQFAKIVHEDDSLNEAIESYLAEEYDEGDAEHISFNSIMLKTL